MSGHSGAVRCLALFGGGRWLLSGSADATAVVTQRTSKPTNLSSRNQIRGPTSKFSVGHASAPPAMDLPRLVYENKPTILAYALEKSIHPLAY
jgi:hypothetical protein